MPRGLLSSLQEASDSLSGSQPPPTRTQTAHPPPDATQEATPSLFFFQPATPKGGGVAGAEQELSRPFPRSPSPSSMNRPRAADKTCGQPCVRGGGHCCVASKTSGPLDQWGRCPCQPAFGMKGGATPGCSWRIQPPATLRRPHWWWLLATDLEDASGTESGGPQTPPPPPGHPWEQGGAGRVAG